MATNEFMSVEPQLFSTIDGSKSYMYEQLWKLCAGCLCDLPKLGEKVYYFPQGHMEIFEASTREDLNQMKPLFDLPSKLLCRVIAIHLKAEKDTDEVYAEIALMPDSTQVITPIPNGYQEKPILHSFTKILTSSDASIYGGLSIRKGHAIECLPPLDMSRQIPTQGLITKDIHDHEWRFQHIFRSILQKHVFSDGWSAFVSAKRLVAGDCFIFLREENGELRVGIRRAGYQQGHIPSRVISNPTMHHGVIASVVHAFSNQCMFIVVYKPRLSQFVVSYDKFVDAVNNKFNIGSRFMMRFEGENFSEIRYSGTIIGINDFSPYWKDSEWRNLQVQWDEHSSFLRPDKVSPWQIEHLPPSTNIPQSLFFKQKCSRQVQEIGSTSSNLWTPTLNQGLDIGKSSMSTMMSVPKFSDRDVVEDSKTLSGSLMSYSVPTMSKPNYNNDQMVLPMNGRIITGATTSFRLFGVDMTRPSHTKDSIGPIDLHQKSKISIVSEEKNLYHTQALTSPNEVQSRRFNSIRSRTKVQMQGVAIGRALDLTVIDGYNQLIDVLDKLFDLKGQLQTRNQWEIVFTDDEGDMMLVGDDPWREFCNMVTKIFICSKEEVKKIKSGNKFG